MTVFLNFTIPLFPEFRGNFDDKFSMTCVRIHSTDCCCVSTGKIVQVPPADTI